MTGSSSSTSVTRDHRSPSSEVPVPITAITASSLRTTGSAWGTATLVRLPRRAQGGGYAVESKVALRCGSVGGLSWRLAGMQLPRFLVKMIDPGTVYMQDRSPRRPGPIFRGGAVFGPGIPGGARQATYQELVEMRAQAETARREFEGVSRRPVDPSITSHAAHELIERGTTTMHVGNRELIAHVVRFWRGESVLEITVAGLSLIH